MKIFRRLFFLSTISLLSLQLAAQACSPPLAGMEGSRLFKAGIDIYKRHYSGLFLFKAMPDSSLRIVFLSEIGLSLLDMRYRDGDFEVVQVQDFLDRKTVLRALQDDLRTLLLDLSLPEKVRRELPGGEGEAEQLRYRYGAQRYRLSCCPGGSRSISRRKVIVVGAEYRIAADELLRIRIRHRGVKMKMELQELKR